MDGFLDAWMNRSICQQPKRLERIEFEGCVKTNETDSKNIQDRIIRLDTRQVDTSFSLPLSIK